MHYLDPGVSTKFKVKNNEVNSMAINGKTIKKYRFNRLAIARNIVNFPYYKEV